MGEVTVPADWKPHPRFPRVSVKPLVTGEMNAGLSVNLVRIAPGGEIAPHTHPEATETFYILKGRGVSRIGREEITLEPGTCAYAPPQVIHGVCNTGDAEMEALSIFNPPT